MKSDSMYFFLVFVVVLLSSIQSTIIMADNRLDTIVVTAARNEQSLAGITINTDWVDEDSDLDNLVRVHPGGSKPTDFRHNDQR